MIAFVRRKSAPAIYTVKIYHWWLNNSVSFLRILSIHILPTEYRSVLQKLCSDGIRSHDNWY